jgi:hypothetical protein
MRCGSTLYDAIGDIGNLAILEQHCPNCIRRVLRTIMGR